MNARQHKQIKNKQRRIQLKGMRKLLVRPKMEVVEIDVHVSPQLHEVDGETWARLLSTRIP